jgi:hypothetical protein
MEGSAITTDTQVRNGVTFTMPVVMISTTMPNTPKVIRPASVFSMNGLQQNSGQLNQQQNG